MRPFKLSIATSATGELPIKGDYIRLDDLAPDCTVEVVESDNRDLVGHKVTMKGGDAFKFISEFKRLNVTHSEGTTQAVEGIAGYGELQSSRTGGTVSVSGQADLQAGTTITNSAVSVLAVATVLVALSSGRKSLRFQNLGAADIYIGGVGVTVATGQRVAAGEIHIEDNAPNAAWSAISGTTGQDMRVQAIS